MNILETLSTRNKLNFYIGIEIFPDNRQLTKIFSMSVHLPHIQGPSGRIFATVSSCVAVDELETQL